ncbi:MAG TPA: hypothetical protein DEA80_24755 [Afipia sp.]|nr:hypothetical protein [Afipia sp.]OUX61584.1 MAG: hypothetical protein CBB64_10210 [Afipia sp. TMED4]HAO40900.1 hypothetical protein [Afipia sp.]HAP11792.1 hypothetical protein [Afipia sp.]HAP48101.1 hypothetical protein [Afipia sp.]|tara:strand:- start:650 stop:862 length:213 start_codon:yes stop_codon:yes gene_type:complete
MRDVYRAANEGVRIFGRATECGAGPEEDGPRQRSGISFCWARQSEFAGASPVKIDGDSDSTLIASRRAGN